MIFIKLQVVNIFKVMYLNFTNHVLCYIELWQFKLFLLKELAIAHLKFDIWQNYQARIKSKTFEILN